MRLPLVLAVLPLFLSGQLAVASDDQLKVDFDKGVDVAALLQRARELAAKQLTPILPAKRKLLQLKKTKTIVAGPGQYQPVSPLITGSAGTRSA